MSKSRFFLFATLGLYLALGQFANAFELLNEDKDPKKVVNTLPMSESPWRSKVMQHTERFNPDTDREWAEDDFFVCEFGSPCDFSDSKGTEEIKKNMRFMKNSKYRFKNNAFEFMTGKKGFWFAFGPERSGQSDLPSLRMGKKWGKHTQCLYRIVMTVSQDVKETEWEYFAVSAYDHKKSVKKFKIKGGGKQVFETDLGAARTFFNDRGGICGFQLKCLTPGAKISIKQMKIMPYTGNVYFRRKFKLDFEPVIAHATYECAQNYDLYINGEHVDKGLGYTRGTIKTLDLVPYLKAGENTIAVRKEYRSLFGGTPEYIFEGVAISEDGQIARIICPQGWKSAKNFAEGWTKSSFDDSKWKTPVEKSRRGLHQVICSEGSNGETFWTGVQPRHMGMLQAKPLGQKFPVWSHDQKAQFIVKLPAGVKDTFTPRLKIYKAQTKDLVGTITAPQPKAAGKLNEYIFTVENIGVGPFRLEWELVDSSGKVTETDVEEMVMAGPIPQERLGLGEFEEEFEKRLEQVRHIDCTKKIDNYEEFCDHSGMYHKQEINKGKVVSANGMTYRETGKGTWSWFAYRLHNVELGKPYLAEVVVPDNADRYIYAAIMTQWPVGFHCNFPSGDWGDHTATGTCITGVDQPLSMKKKKIRFVFWPSSKCLALTVMSGFGGFPAAACEINIYKINGGLPALKVPDSERMFGSHNERITVMTTTTGMSESPLMEDPKICTNGTRYGWLNWYRALERKINWLRFQGRNMTVEGVYMYEQGCYPSIKHNRYVGEQTMDAPRLAIKMYEQNNIHCLLGVELKTSSQIWATDLNYVSDRKMWATGDGIHFVDKYGRQTAGTRGMGINFLSPKGEAVIMDLLGEIYDFYKDAGKVSGFFVVAGGGWQPAFTSIFRENVSTDVGYGDYTVGLFEKETGIKLKIEPKSRDRFIKRYEALMGKHKDIWLYWRAKKRREFYSKIEKLIQSGTNKWELYVFPRNKTDDNPFRNPESLRKERDRFYVRDYLENAVPVDMYLGGSLHFVPEVKTWGKFTSPYLDWMYCKGVSNNRGTRAVVKRTDSIYFNMNKTLDEVDQPAGAAKKWIWSRTCRGVFTPRWAGENAMAEFVNVLSWSTPKTIFYSWNDMNMSTGCGREIRRFAKGFLVTPDVEFTDLPQGDVTGVIAQTAEKNGKTYLRLTNNCPYYSRGTFSTKTLKCKDLVYDRKLSAKAGKYSLELKPYDIRTFELEGLRGNITCDFSLSEEAKAELLAKAEFVLQDKVCLESIPGDYVAKMFKALTKEDAHALRVLMDDYEAKAAIKNADVKRKAIENQKKFIADLEADRGRIICAAHDEYTAPDGSRWLPDQEFIDCGAYGNQGTTYVNRGNLEVEGTDADYIYQTEAYGGRVFYRIPVPEGEYNIRLHFAETFRLVGVNGEKKSEYLRGIQVKVEQVTHPEKIDPYRLAGGWGKPYILEMKNIPAYDGQLDIEMTGNVEINGIEVERAK